MATPDLDARSVGQGDSLARGGMPRPLRCAEADSKFWRKTMLRLLTCVLAVGCVGTSAMLVQKDRGTRHSESFDARLAADGAFRDGLYLGKLDRPAKNPMHPAVGRWARKKIANRSSPAIARDTTTRTCCSNTANDRP